MLFGLVCWARCLCWLLGVFGVLGCGVIVFVIAVSSWLFVLVCCLLLHFLLVVLFSVC